MISVIVPAFNEAEGVGQTLTEIADALAAGGDCEILLVDDGSEDDTAEIAERAGATVLRHPHNAGYGKSLKDGIRAARHDTVVICDADGSYSPEAIPELVAEFRRGVDMVVGARQDYRDSLWKSPLRRILRWLVEYTAGRRIPDVNSGLRVFSRQTILPFLPTLSDSFSFTTSLSLAYMMSHRFVVHHPIAYRPRRGVSKVRLVRDSLRTLQYIVQAVLYYNPLKIFILLSALCVALALAGGLLWLALRSPGGLWLAVGGLLSAILVFCLGLLADLLKQILDRTRA